LSNNLESIKRPNFFFVGHTRSGTTSLKEELEQHPEIYFYYPKSWQKPNGPFGFESSFKNEEEFLEEFRGVKEKRVGQKRGDYLSCPWAAERIKKFSPNAKIIMTLRNPIDVMHSLHATMLYRETVEDIEDFGEALKMEEERKKKYGYKVIPKKYHPHMLYRETVRYSQQVKRYFKLFGEENVKVTIFDEYIKNKSSTLRDILKFLDVDEDFEIKHVSTNAGRKYRNRTIHSAVMTNKFGVRGVLRNIPGSAKIYRKINNSEFKRKTLEPSLRKSLQDDLKKEIDELSLMLKKDLSYWYEN
jgi:hypothetical protein|tara:strand:+ start:7830 stop:8732 length:903 start_codon:yes stop_codon:yes gene_type:complete